MNTPDPRNPHATHPTPDGLHPVDQTEMLRRAKSEKRAERAEPVSALILLLSRIESHRQKTGVCPICGFSGACSDWCATHEATDAIFNAAVTIIARRTAAQQSGDPSKN